LVLGLILGTWFGYNLGIPPAVADTPSKPTVAPESIMTLGVDRTTLPVEIIVLKPNKQQLIKIEKKLAGELPPDTTAIKDLPKLPYGGYAAISLETIDLGTTTKLTVYPRPRPFFEWLVKGKSRELSGYFGYGGNSQVVKSLEVTQDLFRTGGITWNVKVGAIQFPALTEPYAMIGGSVKF